MAATSLGSRIRARRQRNGWKLTDLADRTKLSVPYLSDLERDQGANPTLETLQTIADALGFLLTELLGDRKPYPGADVPLSVSLQRFVDGDEFQAQLRRLASRAGRKADQTLRNEVIDFLANAPRRSKSDLGPEDWTQLLNFYMVIAERR